MGWATHLISNLKKGETVTFRPRGNSMTPLIKNGEECTVSPDLKDLKIGDVVLCKVNGNEYLHLLKAIKGNQFLIGNNHGKINGWTTQVFGKLIKVNH